MPEFSIAKVFRFEEGREVEVRMRQLGVGDVFRVEGVDGMWKAIGSPQLLEGQTNWSIDAQRHDLLLG